MSGLSIASPRVLSTLALLGFLAALLGFGAATDGYSHAHHPVALLGARGVPHWAAFDLLAFVVPGLLAWAATMRSSLSWQARNDAGWATGIGWTLCTFAAIAFAAQGALPVDATKGFDFGLGRVHTMAWTVWWIASVTGMLLLAIGMRGASTFGLRFGTALVAAIVLAFTLFVAVPGAPAMGQRIAFVTWLAWVAWMAWRTEAKTTRAAQ